MSLIKAKLLTLIYIVKEIMVFKRLIVNIICKLSLI